MKTEGRLDRRAFIAALALWPGLKPWPPKKGPSMNEPQSSPVFPSLSVTGRSYFEIGAKIGEHFRDRIRGAIEVRRPWVEKLEAFVAADRHARYDGFLSTARNEFPHLIEEMKGYAEGAGVSFERMFTIALNPELGAMMRAAESPKECTTVALAAGDKLWVGHNEDGASVYRDLMYLLDVTWPSGVRSWTFCYPGYFPGNGPSVNSAGMTQTVNFIAAKAVRPGVPRYVLDRAGVEARTLDEALKIALHPRRSYSQHHLFLSRREAKLLAVEVTPERDSVVEVSGVYVHANHLTHEKMKDETQLTGRPDTSRPRQRVADAWAAKVKDPAALEPDDLLGLLSSHENAPLSICRHVAAGITGSTLGSVMILGREGRLDFFEQEPCRQLRRGVEWPEAAGRGR